MAFFPEISKSQMYFIQAKNCEKKRKIENPILGHVAGVTGLKLREIVRFFVSKKFFGQTKINNIQ